MILNDVTILIVAFKPKYDLLVSQIQKFNENFPILIINNSEEKLDNYFYDCKNVKVIESERNSGNGAGINLGLKNCDTNYVIYLDIDVVIDEKNLIKFLKYAKKIKKFGVLIPNSINYNPKSKILKKWDIEGSIMLFNKKILNNKIKFDENYFLYYEETDFFFNCMKMKIDIFFITKIIFFHNNASSIDTDKKDEIKALREWHFMWSKYYFYKKNFGLVKALRINLPYFFKDCVKLLIYLIVLDINAINLRYNRITGFINSLVNLKSSKRLK